ncbi:MAG: AAA family ATPase, partial [Acidobacteria bacterium]|nr:AAA family ATPase [Acidobacteriota bacterium]
MNFPFEDENQDNYDPSDCERENFREFIQDLPAIAPPEIAERLEQLGYKGQDEPRRALSLMAYRHIRRLKRLHIKGESRRLVNPKQNTLLVGPTGCGKTFLVESLFQQVFQLPTVIVDITSFTESGYIGDDVSTILTRLLYAAEGNLLMASCGIVCLDEFDKLASSTSNSRFAGEGTTKDVSGYGVQRELLKLVEGAQVMVPMDYGYSAYGQRSPISTRDIPFIACGTFSGMDELVKNESKSIGFRTNDEKQIEQQSQIMEEIEVFQRYGFLPELMGRFARIVRFQPLSTETLRRILIENVLPQFIREFKSEGLQLAVTDAAINYIVERSLKRGTGARGLHSGLISAIEQAAFDSFQRVTRAEVVIDMVNGRLKSEIRR